MKRLGSLSTKKPNVGRRGRRRLAAGAVAVAAALTAGSALNGASAFEGPRGHRQWVQIVTKGAPTWSAEMWLYGSDGKEYYHWKVTDKIGGKETWWYSRNGGSLIVRVSAKDEHLSWKHKKVYIKPKDPDGHCFMVYVVGELYYTGDSKSGGCTPE
jgi:hypothetical protein